MVRLGLACVRFPDIELCYGYIDFLKSTVEETRIPRWNTLRTLAMTRDIFRPFSDEEREEKLRAFAEFVKEHDGVPDLAARTLSRREETLKRFRGTTILYPGTLDRALFDAQYRHYDKRRKTPQEILLLLTFIKFNNIEAFTVEKAFRAVERGVVRPRMTLNLFCSLRSIIIRRSCSLPPTYLGSK